MAQAGVTADSLIHTGDGLRPARALALLSRRAQVQYIVNMGGSPLDSAILPTPGRIASMGRHEVVRLTTREGYSLRLTPNMEVGTPNGWVRACGLLARSSVSLIQIGKAYEAGGGKRFGSGSRGLMRDGRIAFEKLVADTATSDLFRLPLSDGGAPSLFEASDRMQRAFLQRLWDARGDVAHNPTSTEARLRVPQQLRQDIQLLHLNLGISTCALSEEVLAVYGDNLIRLNEEFGFINEEKDERLSRAIADDNLTVDDFTATVLRVEPDGVAEVFSFAGSEVDPFAVNGLVVRVVDSD